MNIKIAPYILLTSLFVIVVFFVGVKYGKIIEHANKKIDVTLSVIPTFISKAPTPTIQETFTTYTSKNCGITFLYPNTLSVGKDSSDDAHLFKSDKTDAVYLNCSTSNSLQTILKDNKTSTHEATLKNQSFRIYTTEKKPAKKIFVIKNPLNFKQITISIDENLYTLFANTVQYLP